MTALLPQTLSELIDILDTQPPGTLLMVYWIPEDYPVVTQIFRRQRTHYTTDLAVGDCIIVPTRDIINAMRTNLCDAKFALMCWQDARQIDLSAIRD